MKKYDVEPEDDEDTQTEGKNSVQITKGTEIEQVTKEATEALREETEKLNINKD